MAVLVCVSQHDLSVAFVLLTLERDEVLHTLSLASSQLVLTVCDHGQGVALTSRLSHTASPLVHYSTSSIMVMDSQDSRRITLHPPGAMVSDAQHSTRVDSCHFPSTSASAHEVGHLHTYPKPHTQKQFTSPINVSYLSLVKCFGPRSEEFVPVGSSPL